MPRRLQDPLERFAAKLSASGSGCWIWEGATFGNSPNSYGAFKFEGKAVLAHRWAYENIARLDLQKGLEIDHMCRNSLCQRPGHMQLVNCQTNISLRDARIRLELPDGQVLAGPSRTLTMYELLFGAEHGLPTAWTRTPAEQAATNIDVTTGAPF